MIRTLIADKQLLTRKGITSILSESPDIEIIGEATDNEQLEYAIRELKPDVTLFDAADFTLTDSQPTNLLVLYNPGCITGVLELVQAGVQNCICKNCSHEEIIKAVHLTAKGERFFCGYSLLHLQSQPAVIPSQLALLSERETEIVNLIATGMANKAIAEQLFLSIHTVSTHRKNIIKKLGFTFKNAADLVNYLSNL
jgi:DNA-binding NarL/FixJ family response regulator